MPPVLFSFLLRCFFVRRVVAVELAIFLFNGALEFELPAFPFQLVQLIGVFAGDAVRVDRVVEVWRSKSI